MEIKRRGKVCEKERERERERWRAESIVVQVEKCKKK